MSRSNLREPEHVNHARTGSSPASMIGEQAENIEMIKRIEYNATFLFRSTNV